MSTRSSDSNSLVPTGLDPSRSDWARLAVDAPPSMRTRQRSASLPAGRSRDARNGEPLAGSMSQYSRHSSCASPLTSSTWMCPGTRCSTQVLVWSNNWTSPSLWQQLMLGRARVNPATARIQRNEAAGAYARVWPKLNIPRKVGTMGATREATAMHEKKEDWEVALAAGRKGESRPSTRRVGEKGLAECRGSVSAAAGRPCQAAGKEWVTISNEERR
mmetsp:Transcript_29172/g.89370  ORF Transcript_29172/g.89370 Transcript_29172/m.89370 type:complete len:217 (-) Transcript_29172:518-1168(-)